MTALVFAWAPDRVTLQNGAVLEGEILTETADAVEIRIGEGQIVGVSKKSAKEIFRDPNRPAVVAQPKTSPDSPKLPLGEESFLVEDREGRPHAVLRMLTRRDDPSTANPTGGYVLQEQWSFREANEWLRVSWVESLTEDLKPRELLYREEGAGAGKIVLAKLAANRLEIEISGGPEKRKLSLPWDAESRFPLAARAELRDKALREATEQTISVFDPRLLSFERRRITLGARRQVEWQGEERTIFFYRGESETGGAWEEWIDPRHGVLRRECNGPDLVARRAKSEEIEEFLKGEAKVLADRSLADPLGRFRIRLGDSIWKRDAESEGESVLLQSKNGETAALFFLQSGSAEEKAAQRLRALDRRLALTLAEYRAREESAPRSFQGRDAVEFGFSFSEAGVARRGRALLIANEESSLAVVFSASPSETAAVSAEWERLLARIDLP